MRGIVRTLAVAALGYFGVLGIAQADYLYVQFWDTDVAAFGSGPYGSVTVTENAAGGVDFSVMLRSDLNFITTGNQNSHAVFSLDATGVSLGDFGPITDLNGNTYLALSPGNNSPFGQFDFGIFCSSNCESGGSGGGYNDPLTFSIANATLADFGGWDANGFFTGHFAADVICVSGSCNGATGAVGVPEPGTLALLGLGLAGLGLGSRRRRKT